MHTFPSRNDLEFLRGVEFELAIIARYSVQLKFSNNVQMSIEKKVRFVDRTGNETVHDTQTQVGATEFTRLLGERVTDFSVEDGKLSLVFEKGDLLQVLCDDEQTDCGTLADGTHYWVF